MNTPEIGHISLLTSKFSNLTGLLNGVIDWLLGLAGSLAMIAIIYSGLMYITAGGDTAKAETAKKNLIWAIIGIVLITLAYVIIHEVGQIIGAF
jgi:hypothetical protein